MGRRVDPDSSPTRTRAERNIAWIEKHCRVPEGRHVGKPVKLRDWQCRELIKIYDNPAGTRLAILSFGRKNGKTALAAFLLLLHLAGPEARPNSQLFSAAQAKEQAAILFKLAAKVVRQSPTLSPHVVVRDTVKELLCPEMGSLYRALSAEASTAYGLSPVFIVHDELGQVKHASSELYEALETATGAQDEPLSIVISTQAPSDAALLSVLIDDAMAGHDPRTVVSLYAADPNKFTGDAAFSDEALIAANPAFGDFQNAEEVRAMASRAKRMPTVEAEFRNLVLNQRVDRNSPFVSRSVWQSCLGEVVASFEGLPVYAGLDLSSTTDLTALVLLAKPDDGRWHCKSTFWLPADGLDLKAQKDRVPYDVWEKQGFLFGVPGRTVDYRYVAEHLRELFEMLDIRKIAFDRWNFKTLRAWLVEAGFGEDQLEKFEEFGQGHQSMSPALRELESDLLNGKLVHDGNPVLTMCAAKAVVEVDAAGNRKLTKAKSAGRIDGMVALAMAHAMAVQHGQDEGGFYVTESLMIL